MANDQTIGFHRTLLLAWRGWSKACPRCGGRSLFIRWFTLRDRCPHCQLRFEREEGYWTGAIAANVIMTELVFVSLMVLALVLTWPDPPVAELIIGGVLVTVLFPLFFYPFSKTIWMGFDRAFNPSDQPFRDDE